MECSCETDVGDLAKLKVMLKANCPNYLLSEFNLLAERIFKKTAIKPV